MGTNYYRIPSAEEIRNKHEILKARIDKLLDTENEPMWVERDFRNLSINGDYSHISPWEDFINGNSIHLGKRSGGWKFLWNFHKNKYYTNKEELFAFICSGRVVNEYGEELNPEEFIEMAMNWDPTGWDTQTYYEENPRDRNHFVDYSLYYDSYIDGLRVSSSTEFS